MHDAGATALELHEVFKQLDGKYPLSDSFKAYLLGNFFREVSDAVTSQIMLLSVTNRCVCCIVGPTTSRG